MSSITFNPKMLRLPLDTFGKSLLSLGRSGKDKGNFRFMGSIATANAGTPFILFLILILLILINNLSRGIPEPEEPIEEPIEDPNDENPIDP